MGIGTWTTQGPGADGETAFLEMQPDDTLRMTSWGDCQLKAALPQGQSPVVVTAPSGGVDGAVTDPVVMVNEMQCTGGRDPEPYLSEPVVFEDDERIVVTMSSDSVVGGADCRGQPVGAVHAPVRRADRRPRAARWRHLAADAAAHLGSGRRLSGASRRLIKRSLKRPLERTFDQLVHAGTGTSDASWEG